MIAGKYGVSYCLELPKGCSDHIMCGSSGIKDLPPVLGLPPTFNMIAMMVDIVGKR